MVPGPTTIVPVSGRKPGAVTITVSTPAARPVAPTAPEAARVVSASVATAGLRCARCTTSPWLSLPFTFTQKPKVWPMPSEKSETASRYGANTVNAVLVPGAYEYGATRGSVAVIVTVPGFLNVRPENADE